MQPAPPSPTEQAQQMEPMLSAAGFTILSADTPEKQQHMASMPPLEVRYYVGKTGKLHYWMADPYYCRCVYIGSEQAYQRYERYRLDEQFNQKQEQIARENLEASQVEEMDMQQEMFNPFGMGYVAPGIYW